MAKKVEKKANEELLKKKQQNNTTDVTVSKVDLGTHQSEKEKRLKVKPNTSQKKRSVSGIEILIQQSANKLR